MERLQKVLARAGVASRRKCEALILQGRVRVNGQVVTKLGTKVDPAWDTIEVDGRPITWGKKVYILLHKPQGYLSDTLDFRGRPSALSLIPGGPLGREKRGAPAPHQQRGAGPPPHPLRLQHQKEYLALVEWEPTEPTRLRMPDAVEGDGQTLRADAVQRLERLGPEAQIHGWEEAPRGMTWPRILLHEGKKRYIRPMCAALGHPVRRLIRIRIGALGLKDLPGGKWRYLTEEGVKRLRSA